MEVKAVDNSIQPPSALTEQSLQNQVEALTEKVTTLLQKNEEQTEQVITLLQRNKEQMNENAALSTKIAALEKEREGKLNQAVIAASVKQVLSSLGVASLRGGNTHT